MDVGWKGLISCATVLLHNYLHFNEDCGSNARKLQLVLFNDDFEGLGRASTYTV
jgi:hypothetical protein